VFSGPCVSRGEAAGRNGRATDRAEQGCEAKGRERFRSRTEGAQKDGATEREESPLSGAAERDYYRRGYNGSDRAA